MSSKVIIIFSLTILTLIYSSQLKLSAAPIDDWQKLIQEGSSQKLDRQYKLAIQSFTKSLAIAEREKLPAKCLPISLCRLTTAEVDTNQITEADQHFKRIVDLIQTQREEHTLDPQVSFWAVVLADEYLSNTKPENQEICLKRACFLKDILYGSAHKECIECLNKLATYYIDQGKTDKAIRILTLTQSIMDKNYGKNPDGLCNTLNQLAFKCRTEHKYQTAEQLELEVIKIANESPSSSNLRAGLPSFYSFIGMNAYSQEKIAEGNAFFSTAMKEARKLKSNHNKNFVSRSKQYELSLVPIFLLDRQENKLSAEEVELKQLIALSQITSTDPRNQYEFINVLSDILAKEGKHEEAKKCLTRAINIAKLPKSFEQDLPELYMRMGFYRAQAKRIDEANEAFSNALNEEKDPKGPHATLVLFWWGYYLEENKNIPLSLEKLNMSLKLASALPADKRGTLLADTLKLIAVITLGLHRIHDTQILLKQSESELQAQKKLNHKLWPNIYNR